MNYQPALNTENDLWFQVIVVHTQLMTGVYAVEKLDESLLMSCYVRFSMMVV